MSKLMSLEGKTFGRMTAISRAHTGNGRTMWHCKCRCGASKIVRGEHLRDGKIVSCGCHKAEEAAKRMTTHGQRNTPEYSVWIGVKKRCYNKKALNYARYGGRGISVDFKNFEAFISHVGPRPSRHHSIDRIDNHGNYAPGNIRWATLKEQARNTRRNRMLTLYGETKCLSEWAEIRGLPMKTVWARLHMGWGTQRALTQPL